MMRYLPFLFVIPCVLVHCSVLIHSFIKQQSYQPRYYSAGGQGYLLATVNPHSVSGERLQFLMGSEWYDLLWLKSGEYRLGFRRWQSTEYPNGGPVQGYAECELAETYRYRVKITGSQIQPDGTALETGHCQLTQERDPI